MTDDDLLQINPRFPFSSWGLFLRFRFRFCFLVHLA